MTNLINSLETAWYISPPWGAEVPRPVVSLLEKVYIGTPRIVGYCCGIEWLQGEWSYAIAINDEVVYTPASQLRGTGKFQMEVTDKPVYALGEKVLFRRSQNTTQFRIVQGIHRIEACWLYTVEWVSPELTESNGQLMTSGDAFGNPFGVRRAWVTDTDLVRKV
ncbi:DUF1392 family protein [Nostoc sp. LEGE 06077]|uniref:DUF1392 family protein n=1 Tax=Nostoc sp. LEGE 06077 TaxID=915325 RepID=UPI00188145E2|nr:DUF1392 family protein [Nostoc sp. LEGE 06077]MBE9209909.1 DUF1392 family protein [Nostoc sp. LEGE 06077]